ncbi:MAG: glycosyltransferase family 4 protein [Candidatus Acidiferrales bacterium]
MRIALLSETFSSKMGYLETRLPKYLARLGAEVHVVAMDLPPYYQTTDFKETYGDFAEQFGAGTVESRDGYTLHIVGHRNVGGHMRMRGLRQKLSAVRPDIVQTMVPIGWIPLEAALWKQYMGYKLFTGSHHHASVFPLAANNPHSWSARRLRCTATRTIPGRLIGLATEKCYAITEDCADIATQFFGVPPAKIDICPLGVDTELFHPIAGARESADRAALRGRLGFSQGDVVCIYTGRFSNDKNPLLLAQAVADLRKRGEPYCALFVGNGVQKEEIQKLSGCVLHPFVPVWELGALFRAADIGVWPTQESLSMLDAAACGLPIVANHTMTASERLNGNGKKYQLNHREDLVRVLFGLRDAEIRADMGAHGAQKMAREFSWDAIAAKRVDDYLLALESSRRLRERQSSAELLGKAESASRGNQ